MARRVTEPTYKRHLVGEVPRFDERRQAFSRAIRGEFDPPDAPAPVDGSRRPISRLFTYDFEGKQRRGHSRTDYALRCGGRIMDDLARPLLAREDPPAGPPVEVDDPAPILRQYPSGQQTMVLAPQRSVESLPLNLTSEA